MRELWPGYIVYPSRVWGAATLTRAFCAIWYHTVRFPEIARWVIVQNIYFVILSQRGSIFLCSKPAGAGAVVTGVCECSTLSRSSWLLDALYHSYIYLLTYLFSPQPKPCTLHPRLPRLSQLSNRIWQWLARQTRDVDSLLCIGFQYPVPVTGRSRTFPDSKKYAD